MRERAEKARDALQAVLHWFPSPVQVPGGGGRPPAVAYSVAWMSSTSFFISGVAAYFS